LLEKFGEIRPKTTGVEKKDPERLSFNPIRAAVVDYKMLLYSHEASGTGKECPEPTTRNEIVASPRLLPLHTND